MLVAAPVVTRPFVWVIALPFVAVRGVAGRLATENALRVPRRTATTASALMVGLAPISGLSVIPQGVQASATERFGNELTFRYMLNSGNTFPVPRSVAVKGRAGPSALRRLDQPVERQHRSLPLSCDAASAADVADNLVVKMRSGRLSAL